MSCRPLLALSGGVSSAASSHGTTGRSEAFRGNGRCSATPIRHPFRQFQYPTSPERLHDTTIRRHWEAARKVDITGEVVALDPAGPLAEAAWAKQRLGWATQALPNGFCGLPVQKTCPHANACLTCPMFVTTAEFLPQHRGHRQQVIELITAARPAVRTAWSR